MGRSVQVGSILFDYTGGRARVEASGETLEQLLGDLDRQFPGLSFRVVDEQGALREHVRFFAGGRRVWGLKEALEPGAEVLILAALSGG